MAETKTRVRVRKSKNQTSISVQKGELDELLNHYADLDDKVQALAISRTNTLEQIEKLMGSIGITQADTIRTEALIAPGISRSTTKIDVKKFKDAVSKADFMASVTVPVGNAKKVLAERELKKCSTTTPGAKKPDVLKVKVKPKPAE